MEAHTLKRNSLTNNATTKLPKYDLPPSFGRWNKKRNRYITYNRWINMHALIVKTNKCFHIIVKRINGYILPTHIKIDATKSIQNIIPFQARPTYITIWTILARCVINQVRFPNATLKD